MLESLFAFKVSPWELILRGTLIYWFLFFLLRFVHRRDSGSVGLADILVIVLIADAAQNGMAGEYKSVSEAFVLIGTIVGWNFWIDWMSFHFRWFERFAQAPPVALIRHGTIVRVNLRRELFTPEDLNSQLRAKGIEKISDVKYAALEPDGQISVVPYSKDKSGQEEERKIPGAR